MNTMSLFDTHVCVYVLVSAILHLSWCGAFHFVSVLHCLAIISWHHWIAMSKCPAQPRPHTLYPWCGMRNARTASLAARSSAMGQNVGDPGPTWTPRVSRVRSPMLFNRFSDLAGRRFRSVRLRALGLWWLILGVSSEVCLLLGGGEEMAPGSVVGCVGTSCHWIWWFSLGVALPRIYWIGRYPIDSYFW
jgi:hypothetical protein